MTEWAKFRDRDAGNGDGVPGMPQPMVPLWRRVRAWTLLLAILAIPVGMAMGGGFWVRRALRPGSPWEDTIYYLLIGVVSFAPLGFVVWTIVRTKIKTGRWAVSAEVRIQRAGQCSTQGCAAKQSSWSNYAVKWASCTAMDRDCPPWQRAAAWAVLAVYMLAMLGMTAIGVICFGMGIATLPGGWLFAGLGVAVLLVPGLALRRLIRGILTGKVGATREDVDQIRGQRAERRAREWQKPLQSKIGTTAFLLVMCGLFWARATLHRGQHPHETWVTPAMFTPCVVYAVWVQFRRPKERAQGQSGQDKSKYGDSSPSTNSVPE